MQEIPNDKNISLLARCQAIHRQALAITANKVANADMAKPRPLKAKNRQMTFFQLAPTDAAFDHKRSNPQKLHLEQQHASARASADLEFFTKSSPPISTPIHCVFPIDQRAIIQAVHTVRNKGGFDCVSISGLVMLLFMKQQIPGYIERVKYNPEDETPKDSPHSYIVVNRTQGTVDNFESWNNDAIIIDSWYGICKTVKEIRKDPDFFLKYPLLDPFHKDSEVRYEHLNIRRDCTEYLVQLEEALEQENSEEQRSRYVIS